MPPKGFHYATNRNRGQFFLRICKKDQSSSSDTGSSSSSDALAAGTAAADGSLGKAPRAGVAEALKEAAAVDVMGGEELGNAPIERGAEELTEVAADAVEGSLVKALIVAGVEEDSDGGTPAEEVI